MLQVNYLNVTNMQPNIVVLIHFQFNEIWLFNLIYVRIKYSMKTLNNISVFIVQMRIGFDAYLILYCLQNFP